MTEPEIDTAIDRAVRDLMNVDADAAFRARVAERLKRPIGRRLRPWLLAVPASAAIIVIALAWMNSTPDAPSGPAPLARVEAPAASAPPPAARDGLPQPSMTPSPAPPARQSSRRTATIPIARGAIVATVVEAPMTAIAPALTALESIDVEPIGQTPVATAEIVVAPLSPITEVQVSPLEPRTARD
jgi:hypothetical protein